MLLPDNQNPSGVVLPDVARDVRTELTGRIDRVGMTHVEVPVIFKDADFGTFRIPAKAEAFVSLDDPFAKGIHMSRLFLQLQEMLAKDTLSFELMEQVLKLFVASHVEISESSFLRISFDYMTERPALKSQNKAWRAYPVSMMGSLEKGISTFELELEVAYSSTCPCSAALARKMIQDNFRSQFPEAQIDAEKIYDWLGSTQGILATPHSQRSYATVRLKLKDAKKAPRFVDLIDLIENKLATPVQAAVKREDEQQFAYLNGQNLMFCEDAARRVKSALNDKTFIADFYVKVNHVESLHPHNAVAVVTKGIKGGYKASE